ncbi:WD40/YVTN/BNR-like repeat-containing protein [Hymenobacter sp. BRD67]|uniref:WD40/YVTN/BNR-like repeat-containing protein n=1 Tax=Hymenobacter sp. BRD67 TaxID=2675877 RepID=UPI001566896F|nr:YCF48-related protein [Hymenobacter sp. BRD67]QKG51965.1 hypothetical protein GKZ67_04245 [Hymenobacter sp. BRD67]
MKYLLSIAFILNSCLVYAQWTNIGPGGEALSGVCFSSATNGWVCGAKGALFHTRDGGATWPSIQPGFQTTGPRSLLVSVAVLNQYDVLVLAQQPDSLLPTQIFYSQTNGYSFKPAFDRSSATSEFAQMSFHTYKLGLLVGAGGAFRYSRDGGFGWDQVPSGTLNDLWAGDSPDGITYYLVGSKGTLRKGSRFEPVSKALNSGTFARLTGVWFVDVNQGYVVGDGGTARRTTDGGASWTPMPVQTTVNLNAVRFLDANTGFIVGDLGTLLLTTDGARAGSPKPVTPSKRSRPSAPPMTGSTRGSWAATARCFGAGRSCRWPAAARRRGCSGRPIRIRLPPRSR